MVRGKTLLRTTYAASVIGVKWNECGSLEVLLTAYNDVFSDTPCCTIFIQHHIASTTTSRIKTLNNQVPIHFRPHFEKEVDDLSFRVIRPLSSACYSLMVMVRKSNRSYWMAINYMQLNSIPEFDAEPEKSIEADLHTFTSSTYFSKPDMRKAYHQILLKDYANFSPLSPHTHRGLKKFCWVSCGLVTDYSTYISLMEIILADPPNIFRQQFYLFLSLVQSSCSTKVCPGSALSLQTNSKA